MNKELLIERIKLLCKQKGVNMTQAFEESNVGKNFNSNLKTSNPSKKNLTLLAEYFGCSIEYLLGTEGEEENASRAMGRVMEWLEDNDYIISEDDNAVLTIEKDGRYCYYTNADFVNESLAIKAIAQEGFELAMLDWQRRTFPVSSVQLTSQEETLIQLFRNTTEVGRLEMISAFMQIQKDIEKKHPRENPSAVG